MKKYFLLGLVSLAVILVIIGFVNYNSENRANQNSNTSNMPGPSETNLEQEAERTSSGLFDASYNETASERKIAGYINTSGEWKDEDEVNLSYTGMIYEIDRFRDAGVKDVHVENAWTLYNRTYEAAERKGWFNYSKAKEDGFDNPDSPDHYVNVDYFRDNETLNPEKPEFLMFRNNSNGTQVLVGVMFMQNDVDEHGRQIGGSITKWHYHAYDQYDCYYNGYAYSRTADCPESYYSNVSPEMLHVWFVEHKEGIFATNMYVPAEEVNDGPKKLNKSEFVREVRMRHGGPNTR